MIKGKKIVVVMPAYNAATTLEKTYKEIPHDIVDEVILVDDFSNDSTTEVAGRLGIPYIIRHEKNEGYVGNQKTCYKAAIGLGADVVIMLHPDYQYNPSIIPSMAFLIASNVFPVVLGSRILGNGALKGGMPLSNICQNRVLTFVQNLLLGYKLSEYHTGYRAFSSEVLKQISYEENSNDFIFDNELLVQIIYKGYDIGEITCPAKYEEDSSSINFQRSVKYGLGVLKLSFLFRLNKWGLVKSYIFH